MQPVLFISHGSEDNFSKNTSFNFFLKKLSEKLALRKPDIIICLSSLWNSEELIIGTNLKKEIIYQDNLYNQIQRKPLYPASNAIIFSKKLELYLRSHGLHVKLEHRGFDFGTWGVLSKLFPEADIPVVQMSIPDKDDVKYYYQLGNLLQNFSKKNVLILVSGGLVYNMQSHQNPIKNGWIETNNDISLFSSWINQTIIESNIHALLNYKKKAPLVDKLLDFQDLTHFNSLFIAMGATQPVGLKRMHSSIDNGFSYECFISKSLINQ